MSAIICSSSSSIDNGTDNHHLHHNYQQPDIKQLTVVEGVDTKEGGGEEGGKQDHQDNQGKRGNSADSDEHVQLNTISLTSLDTTDDDEDRITAITTSGDDSSFDDCEDDPNDHPSCQQDNNNITAEGNNIIQAKTISWSESVSDLSLNAMTISPSKSDHQLVVSSVSPLSTESHDESDDVQQQQQRQPVHDLDATITNDNDDGDSCHQQPNGTKNRSPATTVLFVNDDSISLSSSSCPPEPPQSLPVCSWSVNDASVSSNQYAGDGDNITNKNCTVVYCGPPPVKPPRASTCQLAVNHQSTPL